MATTKTWCWPWKKEVTIITVLVKTEQYHTKLLMKCRTIKNSHLVLSYSFFDALKKIAVVWIWYWTITYNFLLVFWNLYSINRKVSHVYSYRWNTPNHNFHSIKIAHSHVTIATTNTWCWPWKKEVTIITALSKNWPISHKTFNGV